MVRSDALTFTGTTTGAVSRTDSTQCILRPSCEYETENSRNTKKQFWGVVAHWQIRRLSSGFEFRSCRQVETLGKSFTRSCLWGLDVKLRHRIRAVSGAPLNNSGLEEALRK